MNIYKRMRKDDGASNVLSAIVILLFAMMIVINIIDVGLYFNTKNIMQSAVENGARSVAIYGGKNTNVRKIRGSSETPEDLVWNSIPEKYRKDMPSTFVIDKRKVSCWPDKSKHAGDEVGCQMDYKYKGIAGKFGMFNLGYKNNKDNVTVMGTSVSEVSTTSR